MRRLARELLRLSSEQNTFALRTDVDRCVKFSGSAGTTSRAFPKEQLVELIDSIIIDLVLPNTDTYFVQVNAFSENDLGDYELFFHRFNGVVATVPEPSAIAVGLLALGVNAIRRRRSLSLAA